MSGNDDAVWRWSATVIADAVRSRRLSAVEATQAAIARLEAVDRSVNAYATVDTDGAMAAARSVDSSVLAGRDPGPLAGVPFSVKDLVATRGVETAYGSHVFAGSIPDRDAEAVARLRRAGAVLIGKTNTPEFGHKALTSSPRYGYTRNPWNLERSPGGSSGGAAAAVAMGMGPLAVTTDGAGSSRIPASACGVLGLKPTLGRVPNETAVEQFSNFINIGLATRTVADLAAGLTAMSGACAGDPWSIAVPASAFAAAADPMASIRGLRILALMRMGNEWVDHDVERLLHGHLAWLRAAGAVTTDGPDEFDWAKPAQFAAMRAYQRARLDRYLESHRDLLDPSLVAALEQGRSQDLLAVQRAPAERAALFRRVQALFDDHDLIVTPTVSAPPPSFDHGQDDPMRINGIEVGPIRANWYSYTGSFNHTGHPAISIPMGFTGDGLPAGFHAVGRWFDEQRLIDLAAAFEVAVPWADLWPPEARAGGQNAGVVATIGRAPSSSCSSSVSQYR